MVHPSATHSLQVSLGQRLRQARRARGLSQEALGQPEFTKSYISAIERGITRPSLKALEFLARQLAIPITDLLSAIPPADEPDLAAIDAEVGFQLDHAKVLLNTQQGGEALRLLNTVAQQYAADLDRLALGTRYRLYRLRGVAYLREAEPGSARRELDLALSLARQLGDAQEVERVRNALGAVFYAQDMPGAALEQHLQCLHALHTGVVKDLNLRLSIYSNLANDYWALNDLTQAISIYHESLTFLDDVNNLERQAGIYWGLSLAYRSEGDLDRAKLYAARALPIYEAAHNWIAAAQMNYNLAAILIQRGEYPAAERLLDAAKTLLHGTAPPLFLSTLYEHYADLELQREHLPQAAEYAQQSVQLSAALWEQQAGQAPGEAAAQANTVRTYARALRIAGLVEERQGHPAAADTLFQRAVALVTPTGYKETAYDIEFTYAELLTARGEYQPAAAHYRAAAQYRQRSAAR